MKLIKKISTMKKSKKAKRKLSSKQVNIKQTVRILTTSLFINKSFIDLNFYIYQTTNFTPANMPES